MEVLGRNVARIFLGGIEIRGGLGIGKKL